jgi:hypothetical protein
MKAAIIGSTKIALIHLNTIVMHNFKKIYFISRKKTKSKNFILKNKFKKLYNIKSDNYKILNKTKFELINICVNSEYHDRCLEYLKSSNALIIVEKPIISLKKFRNDFIKYLKYIYNKHKKIVVCYPMKYLAKNFIKKFNYKDKIKNIEIFYFTNGRHKFLDIGNDLLPHGLSLLFSLVKEKSSFKEIKIVSLKVNKHNWKGVLKSKDYKCVFNFSQKKSIKKSKFFFKINNKLVDRVTTNKNNKFINYLKFKNDIIKISNPMEDFLNEAILKKNNLNWIKKNKLETYKIMKINSLFNDKLKNN